MLQKTLNFIKYHNAFTVIVGFVFFGIGGAFAASPSTFIDSESTVTQIDNSYLLSLDTATFTPTAEITGITEDTDNYYVAWRLSTVDVDGGVWKPVSKENVLNVSKKVLDGRDLGLYAGEELNQVVGHEQARLAKTQENQKQNGETAKTVVTTYSGLIGKFLRPSETVFPGYEAVIKPVEVAEIAAVIETQPEPTPEPAAPPQTPTAPVSEPTPPPAEPPAASGQAPEPTPPSAEPVPVETVPPADTTIASTTETASPPIDATTTPPIDTATSTPPTDTIPPPADTTTASTTDTTTPPADTTATTTQQ